MRVIAALAIAGELSGFFIYFYNNNYYYNSSAHLEAIISTLNKESDALFGENLAEQCAPDEIE